MVSADAKTDIKQEEIRELVAVSYNCSEVTSKILKYNVKEACIFHLILVGVPSSLILSVKTMRWRGVCFH